MGNIVLESLQANWGIGPVTEAVLPVASVEPAEARELEPENLHPHAHEKENRASCAWVGRAQFGHECTDIDRDVARLKVLMREYSIIPHLTTGGGSGFTHPNSREWREKHWDQVCEFSRLWFSAAGDAVISRYGYRMKTLPL